MTCAFNAGKEVIGLPIVPLKTKPLLLDLKFNEQYEFEQNSDATFFVQGKLRQNLPFWRDIIQASAFVLDIIQNGYKICFQESPSPFTIPNRSSALRHKDFVNEAIKELLDRGCLRETPHVPKFCSPLHVVQQSSGKLRLILDLSHLNKIIIKRPVKYEDLRTVLQLFPPGSFVFSFDLKSAYHHIDTCEDHKKFLSFQWKNSEGSVKFYEFNVLPFGLTTAPYLFTKVMRQLVKYWRGRGYSILLYLDDGIGGSLYLESAQLISTQVHQDIVHSGFTPNNEKSIWAPAQKLTFLGTVLDYQAGTISMTKRRLSKLKSSLLSCLKHREVQTRALASITGQIISMSIAVGNITRLLTRQCYTAIEQRNTWDDFIIITPEIHRELIFWLNNIESLHGKPMRPKSSAVGLVYSDASDTGFGGYMVQCGRDFVSGPWSPEEKSTSSTLRELLAVKYVLLSLVDILSGLTVKWFTDNQNVPRIIECGSSKSHLQCEALSIFQVCCAYGISLEMEWIPRSENEKADFLSRIYDPDDWGLSFDAFKQLDEIWGPHSIDLFANHLNYKVARFNSRHWTPGSEAIDSFTLDWSGENNYICPPICLIPRVLLHMRNCQAIGSLVVPLWPSSPFWPMICSNGDHFNDFVIDWMDLPTGQDDFIPGQCNSIFGCEKLHFRMLVLRINFCSEILYRC